MPVYPTEVLVEQSALINTLLCCKCAHLLKSAVQFTCGHRYCETCAKDTIAQHSDPNVPLRCPACPPDSADGILNENELPTASSSSSRNNIKCYQHFFHDFASESVPRVNEADISHPIYQSNTNLLGDTAAITPPDGQLLPEDSRKWSNHEDMEPVRMREGGACPPPQLNYHPPSAPVPMNPEYIPQSDLYRRHNTVHSPAVVEDTLFGRSDT